MPPPKLNNAAPVAGKVFSAAQQAERAMRDRLSNDVPPVVLETGRIKLKGKLSPMWRDLKARGTFSIGSWLPSNPLTNTQATLEDHYKYGQKVAVFNPCATLSKLRQPGDLKCPKCKQGGVLQGNGLRQGTRCALGTEGQEKVFSYCMTHKQCPEHDGKDYSFSTWDLAWLKLNFKPALFAAVPWVFLPGNVIVACTLVDNINQLKPQGLSFYTIASSRNEEVASKATR